MNRFTVIFSILGFLLIVAGACWMYRPLGPISGGVMLLTAAVISARKR